MSCETVLPWTLRGNAERALQYWYFTSRNHLEIQTRTLQYWYVISKNHFDSSHCRFLGFFFFYNFNNKQYLQESSGIFWRPPTNFFFHLTKKRGWCLTYMIQHLSLRTQKQGKEPKEVEIDSENIMGEVFCWGAESHFKTLCEDINLSTCWVSPWISTISWSQPCQMWIHYESDKISLFLLTGMFCQGSHLSQYRSCSPSLYRKSKTNKEKNNYLL